LELCAEQFYLRKLRGVSWRGNHFLVVPLDLTQVFFCHQLSNLLLQRQHLVTFIRIHLSFTLLITRLLPVTVSLCLSEEVGKLLNDLGGHRLGADLEIFLLSEIHVLGYVREQLGNEDIVD
jgi:hypothetical protein